MTVAPAVPRPRGRPAKYAEAIRGVVARPKKWQPIYRDKNEARARTVAETLRTQKSYRAQTAAGHYYVVTRPDDAGLYTVWAYYEPKGDSDA